jgi:hypothetical protein
MNYITSNEISRCYGLFRWSSLPVSACTTQEGNDLNFQMEAPIGRYFYLSPDYRELEKAMVDRGGLWLTGVK